MLVRNLRFKSSDAVLHNEWGTIHQASPRHEDFGLYRALKSGANSPEWRWEALVAQEVNPSICGHSCRTIGMDRADGNDVHCLGGRPMTAAGLIVVDCLQDAFDRLVIRQLSKAVSIHVKLDGLHLISALTKKSSRYSQANQSSKRARGLSSRMKGF